MGDQAAAGTCPQCGSSADVRTAREFYDIVNAGGAQAYQRFTEQASGPAPVTSSSGGARPRPRKGRGKKWERAGLAGEILTDPVGAAFDVTAGFAGKLIGRGVKKVVNDGIKPAVQAQAAKSKAAKADQQFTQAQADQDVIVARYPGLRTCLRDQVAFLDGGAGTVPVGEISPPATLAQADAAVARLG